ncbi:MAG: hypothetical protein MRY83_01445 [Flavobacteriales bacterium]|nr:hypothetical protein [Flavobacteriales bacterium]
MNRPCILIVTTCVATLGFSQSQSPRVLYPTKGSEITVGPSSSMTVSSQTNSPDSIIFKNQILPLKAKIIEVENDSSKFYLTNAFEWLERAKLRLDSLENKVAYE